MSDVKNDKSLWFNVDVTIINPDNCETRKLYLLAKFNVVEGGYGNGVYLRIIGRGETKFEETLDLRYERINASALETVVLNWVYRYWSGMNGAWDVLRTNIENVAMAELAKKALKPDFELK